MPTKLQRLRTVQEVFNLFRVSVRAALSAVAITVKFSNLLSIAGR